MNFLFYFLTQKDAVMQIINEKELLDWLRISRSTLYRYKTQLGFPFIKVRGKVFYNREEIEGFFRKYYSNINFKSNLYD